MGYESFIRSLTDNELSFLIFRELGVNQRQASRLLGLSHGGGWYLQKSIQEKAKRYKLMEVVSGNVQELRRAD